MYVTIFDSSTLRRVKSPNSRWKFWLWARFYYYLKTPYQYYYQPLDKFLTIPAGRYDGATWAFDTNPIDGEPPAWLAHDAICQQLTPMWNDGTPINSKVASEVLAYQLSINGHRFRAKTWKVSTRLLGCKNTKVND